MSSATGIKSILCASQPGRNYPLSCLRLSRPRRFPISCFTQQRFRGNSATYQDPRNSYLNEVIERRLGIPISLSVIYIAIAQDLGLPAHGVGLPGHFIVGIRDNGDEIYIDPFHGGVRLFQADCVQLVREATGISGAFQPEWLKPVSPVVILTRMLNNLRNIYLHQADWTHALAVVERLRLLQPDLPDLRVATWVLSMNG